MDTERLGQAMARIDAAFSRVEAAAARPRASQSAAALVEQNMRLRETVADTLAEIDALIARIEG